MASPPQAVDSDDFEFRPYQQAIIKVCIERNSIVYLPTGAGKSFIAIQVIKHFSNDLERKYRDGGMRSIFLVNTVCLAKQQAEVIQQMLPYNVGILTGDQGVDYWTTENWDAFLDESEILVATADVIKVALSSKFIKLEQVNVMIFDECHHARKTAAYHEIMKNFKPDERCRIIGLSGMLVGIDGKIKPHTVQSELQQLESTLQSTVITVNNLDDYNNVLMCSTNAVEGFLKFQNNGSHPSVAIVQQMLEAHEGKISNITFPNEVNFDKNLRETANNKVKNLIKLFKDFSRQVASIGPYGGYLSLLSSLIQLELLKRRSSTTTHKRTVASCINVVERCIDLMESGLRLNRKPNEATILVNLSHKARQLISLLKQTFTDPNREKDLQCLVFVKERATAKALYHAIKHLASQDPDFPIKPDFMVGINNELPESIESVLSSNYNSIILEKFKRKETNCIISTSVLEEGIDLQMCNLVVMYDAPDTYRSYIQARGRARVDRSKYVVLVEAGDEGKFRNKVQNWRNVDSVLKNLLLLKTLDRKPPSEESIQLEREDCYRFETRISKSILNNCNSVGLLNRYSTKMPTDRFTNCSIFWRRIDHDDGRISAALQLPSQCCIKEEVISDPQGTVKMAKQHAAFKACKMLYEEGELTENLMPVEIEEKIEIHNDEYFSHWKEYEDDKKSAGTRNNRRYHKVKTPDVLQDSAPIIDRTSFLYRIRVTPKFPATNHALQLFHDMFSNGKEFGILTSKRIPRICKMVLFQSYGEVEVEISPVPSPCKLKNEAELKTLQNFHVVIFRDIVGTWMKCFTLDKTGFLIVPLTEDVQIDWALAEQFQNVLKPTANKYKDIMEMDFSHDSYYGKVINPVYRETEQNYIVIGVHERMSPLSPFPNQDFINYKQYFYNKFDISVNRLDQPMIEVKGIGKNLNLFFPGTGAAGKQRKYEKEHLSEFLIPELCHNYKFPGDYWLKAMLLPSICNRIVYLLFAEELRRFLIKEKIDDGCGPQEYKLDVDYESYDEREKALTETERQHEIYGTFPNYIELINRLEQEQLSSSAPQETRHTKALLLWNKSEMPKDIDRNWLTVSELDLDYYCRFVDTNRFKISPASMQRLQQLNGSPPRHNRFLADSADRSDIKILHLNGELASVQQKDLIKVLTTSNAGDVFDMERFEVLGDAFLKFICSFYLYKRHETYHEGYLTTLKGKLVSNRNLFYIGNKFGLSNMIKSSKFSAQEALPQSIGLPFELQVMLEKDKTLLIELLNIDLSPEEVISGSISNIKLKLISQTEGFEIKHDPKNEDDRIEKSMLPYIKTHQVGDKVIADAVEAFLGCVVQSLGTESGLKLCQKLSILPSDDNNCELLKEHIPPRTPIKGAPTDEARIHNQVGLEKIIGYKFKNRAYLVQAMTHASYPIKILGSYEQLEFLGDAVLDFLVTSYIIERCPKMDPGKLTDLRSSLVNNVTLACVVVRNGIHKFMLSENALLSEAIQKFDSYQGNNKHRVVLDQIVLLETEGDACTAEAVDIPKAIGDIFESLCGAVFLDSGLDLCVTWQVIYGLLKGEIQEFMEDVPKQIVRMLFEYEKGIAAPKFFESVQVGDQVGVPLLINYRGAKKDFMGVGKNRSLAKKCAAKLALKALMEPL